MYRRYTNQEREGFAPNRFKQTLIRDIIIVLLLAGIAVLLVKAIPAFNNQSKERFVYIQKVRTEWDEAVRKVSALSTFGKETTEAEIRCHLYTIQALNDIYQSRNGQALLRGDQLALCISLIDQYIDDNTKGGRNLTVVLSELRVAMDSLTEELNALE